MSLIVGLHYQAHNITLSQAYTKNVTSDEKRVPKLGPSLLIKRPKVKSPFSRIQPSENIYKTFHLCHELYNINSKWDHFFLNFLLYFQVICYFNSN